MKKSVESDGPARKKKKRIDDTAERDEQNKCEEEESTSKTRKKKVPREQSQLMKMMRLHPSIQKSSWIEDIFFTEYFEKVRSTKT